MKKSTGLAAFLLLGVAALVTQAHAEERWPRWYLGLSGGYTYMQDQDVSGATGARKITLDNGFGAGGSIGYLPSSSIPFLNSLRFEGEITYHDNGIDQVKGGGLSANSSGKYTSTAYMFNAFYDLPTGTPWAPYIGGGVGLADLHLSSSGGVGNSSSHDSEFAYQGLVGIGYSPVTIPNTQWTLGYRYLATKDPRFSGPTGNVNSEYSTHSVEVGAKFRF